MIKSQYINDILYLITGEDSDSFRLREQTKYLTEKNIEFTDIGVFVYFDYSSEALNHILNHDSVLNGIKIEIKEFDINAEANLFIENGIINNLEIFCIDGLYPKIEPLHYKITQVWKGSSRRKIEK